MLARKSKISESMHGLDNYWRANGYKTAISILHGDLLIFNIYFSTKSPSLLIFFKIILIYQFSFLGNQFHYFFISKLQFFHKPRIPLFQYLCFFILALICIYFDFNSLFLRGENRLLFRGWFILFFYVLILFFNLGNPLFHSSFDFCFGIVFIRLYFIFVWT